MRSDGLRLTHIEVHGSVVEHDVDLESTPERLDVPPEGGEIEAVLMLDASDDAGGCGHGFERCRERSATPLARLEEAGVLKALTVRRRNRAFEARAVIDAFADLERQLASPTGIR